MKLIKKNTIIKKHLCYDKENYVIFKKIQTIIQSLRLLRKWNTIFLIMGNFQKNIQRDSFDSLLFLGLLV